MRNGMYKYRHNLTNEEVYVKSYNSNLMIHILDSVNGALKMIEYVGPISEDKLKSDYTFVEEVKQNCKWKLSYYAAGICRETIIRNAAFAMCQAKKKQLRRTTHKTGKLIIEMEHATRTFNRNAR